MATITFLAKTALVHIIFLMTIGTGTRRTIMECRAFMAVATTHRTMAGAQREPGFRMIECPALPSRCRVATIASDAQFTLVYIIPEVTGHAGLQCLTIFLPFCMAGAALHIRMQPEQNVVCK